MRLESFQLIKYCGTRPDSYRDVPAAETKSIGLLAFACGYGEQSRPTRWCLVFCSPSGLLHLDKTICVHLSGFVPVKTNYRDPKPFSHLPGPDSYREAKNSAPRHGRQLIKPPGCYG